MTTNLITSARAQYNLNNATLSADESTTLSALITAVSSAACTFCRRTFAATDYDELYNGNGRRRLLLNRYPVQVVKSVRYRPVTVLKVQNTNQVLNQRATVKIWNTGIHLLRVASGVTTLDTSVTWAVYPTLQAVASAISALGGGWTARVVGSASGDYGLWPSADLYVAPTWGDGLTSQGALTARGTWAELKMHTMELQGYQWDPRGWLLRAIPYTDPELMHPDDLVWPPGIGNFRVNYTAGYTTVPEDVQEACAQWVAALFWQTKRDPGLKSESIVGVTSRAPFSTMPLGVLDLLLPYRDHRIHVTGD